MLLFDGKSQHFLVFCAVRPALAEDFSAVFDFIIIAPLVISRAPECDQFPTWFDECVFHIEVMGHGDGEIAGLRIDHSNRQQCSDFFPGTVARCEDRAIFTNRQFDETFRLAFLIGGEFVFLHQFAELPIVRVGWVFGRFDFTIRLIQPGAQNMFRLDNAKNRHSSFRLDR